MCVCVSVCVCMYVYVYEDDKRERERERERESPILSHTHMLKGGVLSCKHAWCDMDVHGPWHHTCEPAGECWNIHSHSVMIRYSVSHTVLVWDTRFSQSDT